MRRISTFLVAGVSLVSLAPALHAQDAVPAAADAPAAEEEFDDANTIVVTARRRDESIQDVPSVVNAVTAADITNLNLRNMTEVATVVPGLELTTNANGIGGNARLRGVNFDVNASGNNPTVEFYLNDSPITAGVLLQQMFDVGQIEVLRGPQGTLRGRASPSGSITVGTKKPDLYEYGGYISATGTNIGTLNGNAALNIPIIDGLAAIRVAGLWDENELDRVRPSNRTYDGRDPFSRTRSGRISALIEPADWIRLEGTYQKLNRSIRSYVQAESFSQVNPTAPASPIFIRAKDRLSINEAPNQVKQEYDLFNWRAEFGFSGQRLIYQGSYSKQQIHSLEEQDFGNAFANRAVYQDTTSNTTQTNHEIRLQNEERVLGMFDYVVGFFDQKNNTPTDLFRPTVVRLPLAFGGGVAQIVQTAIERGGDSHEQSFFGNLTAHIGEATEISGGLRHINRTASDSLRINGALTASGSRDESKWIYNASIKHNFTPDLMVYLSTGSSWRPGLDITGDFNLSPSPLELSFLHLPAESSKSYEIGLKSTMLDGRMHLNVSAYQQKFKNFPYRIPGSGVFYVNSLLDSTNTIVDQVSAFNFVGAVPVTVRGIEGDLSFDVNDRFSLGLTASYSIGKIKNGTIPCNDLNGDGIPDSVIAAPSLPTLEGAVGADNLSACQVSQRSAFLAPFSASLQSEYNAPISDKVSGYLRGLLTYSGKSQGNPTNAFDDSKGFALLNLFAGIRDPEGAWEFSLFAKNVFNKTQVLSRTDPLFTSYQQLPGAIINGVPTITGRPVATTFPSTYNGITTTPAREFGLTFRYAFGSR